MGIKLLAAILSTFFLWSRPTTLPWVVKVSRPEAAAPAAPAAAAAGTAPPWPSSAPQRQTQQRVLQACIRDGGYYEGEWVHRPHTWRPHAHYARGLAGKHKFFDGVGRCICPHIY